VHGGAIGHRKRASSSAGHRGRGSSRVVPLCHVSSTLQGGIRRQRWWRVVASTFSARGGVGRGRDGHKEGRGKGMPVGGSSEVGDGPMAWGRGRRGGLRKTAMLQLGAWSLHGLHGKAQQGEENTWEIPSRVMELRRRRRVRRRSPAWVGGAWFSFSMATMGIILRV
jgi:hypothetical protein